MSIPENKEKQQQRKDKDQNVFYDSCKQVGCRLDGRFDHLLNALTEIEVGNPELPKRSLNAGVELFEGLRCAFLCRSVRADVTQMFECVLDFEPTCKDDKNNGPDNEQKCQEGRYERGPCVAHSSP